MINAYKEGKDLYATIAAGVYKNDYWDNMEKHRDGSPNPEGKKRRSNCKSLLLGIMYGRGVVSIAEQTGGTIQEAQGIIDNFYKSFPKVKDWMDNTNINAKKSGYVEDLWGRRRRLPDISLPKFEITDLSAVNRSFNPILGCKGMQFKSPTVDKYLALLSKCKNKEEVASLISRAKLENVQIKDNRGFIAQAERQCVNARIQGGAATMTKIAMNKIHSDKELNDYGFKLLIGVHDELIGECPKENADKVADRLCYVMKTCIEDVCSVPFKCDADIAEHWYYNDYADTMNQKYKDLLAQGYTEEDAQLYIFENYSESSEEEILKIIN